MTVTTRDFADTAIDLIRENGWVKGKGIGPDGQRCMIVAMTEAKQRLDADTGEYYAATDAAETVIRDKYPERYSDHASIAGNRIVWFNDHPDTTVEDVIYVLENL